MVKIMATKKNKDILIDIVKLTGGNFLFHTKATSEVKENSTNYFVNFCFGELLEVKDYKSIIECYDNELEGFSKEHLPIKLICSQLRRPLQIWKHHPSSRRNLPLWPLLLFYLSLPLGLEFLH